MKRDDLQGVRGLAIGAVVAFHFFPESFPNGYIGVDIFFVLSGFLMAMIIGTKPITCDSVYQFYFRRSKRILPLYLFIVFVGVILVFVLFPKTFLSMNMDSAWSSIFLYHNMAQHSDNNMYFKMLNQAEDIFTHTWSLCVEMQFYILAPAIFFVFSQCTTGTSLALYHIIFIFTSLGTYLFSSDQIAFNSVFCRVWQFLIGSAVFFYSQKKCEQSCSVNSIEYSKLPENEMEEQIPQENKSYLNRYSIVLFIALLTIVCMVFSPWPFPGDILRVTSTIVTGVLILSGAQSDKNPLRTGALVYLGDVSYSLYLIHWPVFVYVKHYYGEQFLVYFLAIIFSTLLAIIMSETYEKWYLSIGKFEILSLIGILYMLVIAIVVNIKGISTFVERVRFGEEDTMVSNFTTNFGNITIKQAIALNRKWARDEYKYLIIPNCYPNVSEHGLCEFEKYQLTGNMSVFIVGNSLAANLGSLVYSTFKNHAKSMFKYSNSFCEVLTIANEDLCRKSIKAYEDEVSKKQPDVLFIIDKHSKLLSPLTIPIENDQIFKEALATLKKYEKIVKKKIYMVVSYVPPLDYKLTKLANYLDDGKNVTQNVFTTNFIYLNGLKRQGELVKRCSKCQLIYISDVLYNGNKTKNFDDTTKLGYYFDGFHITPFARNLIKPVFQKLSDSFID